jgi:hypothetical protein
LSVLSAGSETIERTEHGVSWLTTISDAGSTPAASTIYLAERDRSARRLLQTTHEPCHGTTFKSCRKSPKIIRAFQPLRVLRRCNNEAGGNQAMTSSYPVIYERGDDGTVSAYAPELQPGAVVSTGRD